MGYNMITIGICTENTVFTEKLSRIAKQAFSGVDEWDLCVFPDVESVLLSLEEQTFHCRILFWNLPVEGDQKWNAVKRLRQECPDTDVVFLSDAEQGKHIIETGMLYMARPLDEENLCAELRKCIGRTCDAPSVFPISSHGVTHQIPIASILYIESNLRILTIHTVQADYQCYQKMGEVAEILEPYGFIRCHQSYLVALDKITGFHDNLLDVGGIPVPVSRRYQERMREFAEHASFAQTAASQQPGDFGTLVGVRGDYSGTEIHFFAEQEVLVGRDGSCVDIVINLPHVSRQHCSITYHRSTGVYELADFSKNGTFVSPNLHLISGDRYFLQRGSEISFGDSRHIFRVD